VKQIAVKIYWPFHEYSIKEISFMKREFMEEQQIYILFSDSFVKEFFFLKIMTQRFKNEI